MNAVVVAECCGPFAEDKDAAKEIRETILRAALSDQRSQVVLDFAGVDSSTQSFIHALLSDLLRTFGESMLERIEFRNCNESVRSIIGTVVNYSLD